MRIAFTIIYNGIHHLNHNGFAEFMANNFDNWIVIEGLANAHGSTSWCKTLPIPSRSTDGTHQFFEGFTKQHSNVIYYSPGTPWKSKDEMVNEAVKVVRLITDKCYLWQVDCDEQWTSEQLEYAEIQLDKQPNKAGAFQFTHYLCKTDDGHQLVGVGQWGSGFNTRLFKWQGEKFISHEPPVIQNQGSVAQLSPKYKHWSYYFWQDIQMKGMYYGGHEYIPTGWSFLKKGGHKYPLPLSALFGKNCKKFNPSLSFIEVLKTEIPCLTTEDVVQGQSHVQ